MHQEQYHFRNSVKSACAKAAEMSFKTPECKGHDRLACWGGIDTIDALDGDEEDNNKAEENEVGRERTCHRAEETNSLRSSTEQELLERVSMFLLSRTLRVKSDSHLNVCNIHLIFVRMCQL